VGYGEKVYDFAYTAITCRELPIYAIEVEKLRFSLMVDFGTGALDVRKIYLLRIRIIGRRRFVKTKKPERKCLLIWKS